MPAHHRCHGDAFDAADVAVDSVICPGMFSVCSDKLQSETRAFLSFFLLRGKK